MYLLMQNQTLLSVVISVILNCPCICQRRNIARITRFELFPFIIKTNAPPPLMPQPPPPPASQLLIRPLVVRPPLLN